MSTVVVSDIITGPRVSLRNKTAEFDYKVLTPAGAGGPDQAQECEDAVLAIAPTSYRDWPLDDVVVGPDANSDRTFLVTLKYALAGGGGRLDTGDQLESWTTGGGTAHVRTAKETIATSSGAPEQNGAINVADGKIEGVDVVEGRWSETITKYIANGDIATAKAAAFAATGTVNDDEWRGFNAGEVLLVEVTGQKRSEGDWEVTYRFECKPNVVARDYCDGTFTISHEGWHVIWFLMIRTVDANQLATEARHYYVMRVYEYSDYDTLDLE